MLREVTLYERLIDIQQRLLVLQDKQVEAIANRDVHTLLQTVKDSRYLVDAMDKLLAEALRK